MIAFATVAALVLLAICIGSLLGIVVYSNFSNNRYMISESGIDGHGLVYMERSHKLLFDYRKNSFRVNATYEGPRWVTNEKTRAFFEQYFSDIIFTIVLRYSDGIEENIDVYLKDLVHDFDIQEYQKYGYFSRLSGKYYFNRVTPSGQLLRIFIPNEEALPKILEDYPEFRINVFGGPPRNKALFIIIDLLDIINSLMKYSANLAGPAVMKPSFIPVIRLLTTMAILSFIMLLALALIAITLGRRYADT